MHTSNLPCSLYIDHSCIAHKCSSSNLHWLKRHHQTLLYNKSLKVRFETYQLIHKQTCAALCLWSETKNQAGNQSILKSKQTYTPRSWVSEPLWRWCLQSQASIKPFSRWFNKVVLYSRKSILTEILYPSVASGISVVTKRGGEKKTPTLRRNEGFKPT